MPRQQSYVPYPGHVASLVATAKLWLTVIALVAVVSLCSWAVGYQHGSSNQHCTTVQKGQGR